jgi:hypothetical protein
MVGCMVANFSGAVNVRPGATLKMCGNFTMSGSVNVNDGGSVELTGGSSIAIAGSYTFNGNDALTYVGDPTCLAEMYVTTGVAFVLTGNLTSSNRIHIDGFSVGFGASSGSANIGRPGGVLCGLGILSCNAPDPCAAIVPGTISSNQTICEGATANQLNNVSGASGGDGVTYDYQWQISTDGVIFSDIVGQTGLDYSPGILNATRYYRRAVNSGTCGTDYSNIITITVNPLPSNDLVAVGASRCSTGTVNLSVTGAAGGTTVDWYAAASGGTVLAGGTGTSLYTTPILNMNTITAYYAEVRNSTTGCISSTRIPVNARVDSLPLINLGNDTVICADQNITFNAGLGYPNYLWSTNATVDSILVNTSGQYSVRVTDGNGCIGRDTINLGIYQLPTPRLLNDTNICRGDSVQIGVQNFYVSYNWRTGQTTDSIIINSAATYLVTVVDTNGCVASDSVAIGILELPVVTLGNDTIICIESDYVLNAGNQGVDYLWSTNATSATISTTGANTYWVRVINANGCTTRDTIVVNNHPSPAMSLNIPDTNICLLDTIVLDGGVWDEYSWNYNNSTNQTVNVFAAGTYILTVKNQFGCASSDTTVVGIYQLPNSNLGPDREVCLYKNVDITVPELNATYVWSTNENTRTISSNQPGTYSVVVTNNNGCSTRDTIRLIPGIDLIINLGPDVNICPGVTHGLELMGYDSVRWSTGETTERIVIATTQRVDVLAVDENGCSGRDTIQITSVPNPTVQLTRIIHEKFAKLGVKC